MVSSFHFHQMASFLHDPGTFEEFAEEFLAGNGERNKLTYTEQNIIMVLVLSVEQWYDVMLFAQWCLESGLIM